MRLRSEDLFDSLEKEEELPSERKIEVIRDNQLEELVEGFKRLKSDISPNDNNKNVYSRCSRVLEGCFYDRSTIESFAIIASDHFQDDWNLGIYLSFLMNNHPDNRFTLNLSNCPNPPCNMGFMNNGNSIIVRGDVGSYLGSSMESGLITLDGNAGTHVGENMQGGKIIVLGNADQSLGFNAHRGKITINGYADKYIGTYAKGVRIDLNGDYNGFCIGDGSRADIYHKGKPIVLNGERVK